MLCRNLFYALALGAFVSFSNIYCYAETAVEKGKPSVVRVIGMIRIADLSVVRDEAPGMLRVLGEKPTIIGTGSGFVVTEDGLVGTNFHVVDMLESQIEDSPVLKKLVQQKAIVQELYVGRLAADGKGAELFRAEIEHKDEGRDLAVLRAREIKGPALKLNIGELQDGDEVFSLGYPGDADDPDGRAAIAKWVEQGRPSRVSSPNTAMLRFLTPSQSGARVRRTVVKPWSMVVPGKEGPDLKIIETDVNFSGGNSGGPLLNSAGQVVGVNTAVNQVVRFSSHIRELHDILSASGAKHSWTQMRPIPTVWLIAAAVSGAVLVGFAALFLAFRKTSAPGHTTVMKWVHDMRQMSRRVVPSRPPSRVVPPESSKPAKARKEQRNSYNQDEERSQDRRRVPDESQYSTFELEPVQRDGSPVKLAGASFAQQNGRLILGRSSELAHIQLNDRNVSNRHAAIRIRGRKVYIEDLESSNGTRVNGNKLEPYTDMLVEDGDTITLGSLSYCLRECRRR